MNWYSLRQETLYSTESWLPLAPSEFKFQNVQRQQSFVYYSKEEMHNGILIDLKEDAVNSFRTIYSLVDWTSAVGGFAKAAAFLLLNLFPFLSWRTLDQFLVRRLFKREPLDQGDPSEGNDSDVLLREGLEAVRKRKPFKMIMINNALW